MVEGIHLCTLVGGAQIESEKGSSGDCGNIQHSNWYQPIDDHMTSNILRKYGIANRTEFEKSIQYRHVRHNEFVQHIDSITRIK